MFSRLTLSAVLLAVAALSCCCASEVAGAANVSPVARRFVRRGWFDGFMSMFKKSLAQGSKELDTLQVVHQQGFKRELVKLREAEEALLDAKSGRLVAELQADLKRAQNDFRASIDAVRAGKPAGDIDSDKLAARISAAGVALRKAKNTPIADLEAAVKKEKANVRAFLKADSELGSLRSEVQADFDRQVAKVEAAEKAFLKSNNGKSLEELKGDAEQLRAKLQATTTAIGGHAEVPELHAKLLKAERAVVNGKKSLAVVEQEGAKLRGFMVTETPKMARIRQIEAAFDGTGPSLAAIREAERVAQKAVVDKQLAMLQEALVSL